MKEVYTKLGHICILTDVVDTDSDQLQVAADCLESHGFSELAGILRSESIEYRERCVRGWFHKHRTKYLHYVDGERHFSLCGVPVFESDRLSIEGIRNIYPKCKRCEKRIDKLKGEPLV